MEQVGKILVVCTANVCRSVYASSILTGDLGRRVAVTSAGTDAVPGSEMCSLVRALIDTGGLARPSQYDEGSRRLDSRVVEDADLVITFTSNQRAKVARQVASSRARLFTLREAVALVEVTGDRRASDSLSTWVGRLNARRPVLARTRAAESVFHWWWPVRPRQRDDSPRWDLADAHSASDDRHRTLLQEVSRYAHRLASAIGGEQ
ncbi:hypothetical protein [Micropruina sonneratiae]|uniref:arsenate reductase/protein-tyrosine-phosphatase family protein n=1 Tax=Micropruina sonneratiae TaxID=2986940 RepID=UPI0039B6EFFE